MTRCELFYESLKKRIDNNPDRKPVEVIKEFCSKDVNTCNEILKSLNFMEKHEISCSKMSEEAIKPLYREESKNPKVFEKAIEIIKKEPEKYTGSQVRKLLFSLKNEEHNKRINKELVKTELGKKYINEIVCGNCMDLIKGLPSESVSLVVTDPPYDVDYKKKSSQLDALDGRREKQIERDMDYKEFNIDYFDFAEELHRVLKPDAHCYIWCADKQLIKWITSMEDAGFKFRQLLFWVKNKQTFDLSAGQKYAFKGEPCLFFAKGNRKLNKFGVNNVLDYKVLDPKKMIHPTQKPVEMIEFLINNSSNEGDIVLDTFSGSGSTAIATKNLKRNFICFELSPKFYELSKRGLNE